MNIWVVGASGMLGSSIFSFLSSKEISAVGTNSLDVDITSYEAIKNYVKDKNITHIINCAAYTKVDDAENNENKAFNVNANAAKNLAIISKEIGAKLVHFSTDYVFSGDKKNSYMEGDETKPNTVYGKSKLLGEKFVLSYAIDPAIIRISWLFGFNGSNFTEKIIKQMKSKEEINVVSDQIGRPTFCEDISKNILKILSLSGIFHFANDKVLSWYSFSMLILEIASRYTKIKCEKINPVSSSYYQTLATRPLYSVLSTEKIEKILHMEMPSLDNGLDNYISKICISKIYKSNDYLPLKK